jgi:putative phage-type endonuclease
MEFVVRLVNIKQGTKDWREWRGKGLGASDMPALMGDSPWTSPFELWLQKTGLWVREEPNAFQLAAMKRGNDLEPVVREMFEKKLGKKFPAVAGMHDEYDFIRASFDGLSEDNEVLEIKCPNKVDHEKAVKGKVPTKYIAQVQLQLLISGARNAYYVSWDGRSTTLDGIVQVPPDFNYQSKLIDAAVDFWKRVASKTLPEVTTKDASKIIEKQKFHLEQANKLSELLTLITK